MIKQKTVIISLVSLGTLLIVAGLGWYFKDQIISLVKPSGKVVNPSGDKSKEEFQFEWVEWQDPAGFSFSYPKEVEINDHPEDKTNYAFLELTKTDKKGKIIIFCQENQYPDLETWLTKDELVKDQNSLETKVASMSAKKVALGDGREITAFLDWEGVMYLIDSQPEGEDYWRQIYRQILTSFKMAPLEGESKADFTDWLEGFDTSGADVVEPVEVVE